MPPALHVLSIAMIALGVASAALVAIDVARHPQKMGVMNAVWPLVALFGTLPIVWFYFRFGRATNDGDSPRWVSVAKGSFHCGAGCTLGDLVAETLAMTWPAILVAFGWPGLFGERTFAVWTLDFVFAFAIGIAFQYFAIAPMRDLGVRDGLVAALKADTLSLISWQLGMYGFMAVVQFVVAPRLGVTIDASMPEFWFAMQIAMWCGLATSLPVNAWLLRIGLKEAM